MNGEICQKFGSIGYICLNSSKIIFKSWANSIIPFNIRFFIASRVLNCENGPCDIEFSTTPTNTPTKSTTKGPQNLGAIIGGTFGGVVFLILVAALITAIIIVYKRKHNEKYKKPTITDGDYDETYKGQTYKDQNYNNTYYEKRISNRYSEPYGELYQNVNKNKKTYENVARLDSIDLTTVNNQQK